MPVTLISSALTPDQIATIFQAIVAQILGFDPVHAPAPAFSAVRVGWPTSGQPAWDIAEDVCILRATADDHPYSRTRDNLDAPKDATSINQNMSFTQVWNLHGSLWGPNCYGLARQILSSITLDWVHDALLPSNLYLVPGPSRPMYAPENFQGQWWRRADINIKFNELVNESIAVDSAAGVDVTILTDSGLTEEFQISTP